MIHLIGFSAAGKSTCAPLIATALGKQFIDLDDYISQTVGARPMDLFSEYGQDFYRDLETIILKTLLATHHDSILATAGGTIISPKNRILLKETGTVVYLSVSSENIIKRIIKTQNGHDASRPLKNAIDMQKFLRQILIFREIYYLDIADIIVQTDNIDPSEVVHGILLQLSKFSKSSF